MPISNENFGAVILLSELHIQCSLFQRYAEHLESAAQHWIDIGKGIDDGKKSAPLDIVAYCTVCLAAMAAIRRLIIAGEKGRKPQHRRRALQKLLGDPALPVIASPTVRNSWEHLDDRLDSLLPTLKGGSVSQIHVSTTPLKETIALKRFDPVEFAIHFADQRIELWPALSEINLLSARVDEAMHRLQNETVAIWP